MDAYAHLSRWEAQQCLATIRKLQLRLAEESLRSPDNEVMIPTDPELFDQWLRGEDRD